MKLLMVIHFLCAVFFSMIVLCYIFHKKAINFQKCSCFLHIAWEVRLFKYTDQSICGEVRDKLFAGLLWIKLKVYDIISDKFNY